MALPITITYTFATATGSIPLSQLDTNFALLTTNLNGLNDGSVLLATPHFGSGSLLSGATNPILAQTGSVNGYIQSYIFNASTGISASSDFTAYANNSTDAHGWADMGFTSSTYADTVYTITGPNEAYLLGSALNSSFTGNLVYGTDSTGSQNYHQWYVGGFTQAKSAYKMQLTSVQLMLQVSLNIVSGNLFQQQVAPTALTATATLTIAQILTNIITVTSATAVALTLPTGTLTDAGVLSGTLQNNGSFDWNIINLGSALGAITMTAGTGHTYVGSATVAIGTSAQFRTRKTAANTYVTYRVV